MNACFSDATKKIGRVTFLLMMVLLLLTACSHKAEETTLPENADYDVSFYVGQKCLDRQTIPEGALPTVPAYSSPDYLLGGWMDETQTETVPDQTPIFQNIRFTAKLYPKFRKTAVYLIPDVTHRLRPEDVLTFGELRMAMKALSPSPGVYFSLYNWSTRQDADPVTGQILAEIYENPQFFPESRIRSQAPLDRGAPVTRGEFAQRTFSLLERDQLRILAEVGQQIPGDVDPADPAHVCLLDSCIAHSADDHFGTDWHEAVMSMYWTPGYHLQHGFLYCADETGSLIKNKDIGRLHFDETGCYTSGVPELDQLTVSLLQQLTSEEKTVDRDELLQAAFFYVRDHMHYTGVSRGLAYRAKGWEPEWGLEALRTYRGNCYSYAAAFAMLARNLGFDAEGISGRVFKSETEHGWVLIERDGVPAFYDPQLAASEVVYHRRSNRGEDMFNISLEKAREWHYLWK